MAGAMASNPFLQQSLKRSVSIFPKRQCRCLSSTSRLSLPSEMSNQIRGVVQKASAGMGSQQGQISKLKSSSMPNDLGLQPQILIKPKWKDLPPLLSSQWKRRLRIEWMAIIQRIQNFIRLGVSCKWNVPVDPITKKWQRRPLLLSERADMVKYLHSELNMAVARQNRQGVSRFACNGLRHQLKVRFDRLESAKQPKELWSVEYKGWIPSPKVPWIVQALCPPTFKAIQIIVDSEAQLPTKALGYHRQVVAKIKSRQTLRREDGDKTSIKTFDQDEYVVIQKMVMENRDESHDGWMIWGTTQPATEKQLDKLFSDASQGNLRERFREQFQRFSSDAPSSSGF